MTFIIPARNEESNIEKCILGIKGKLALLVN